ncbi:hypothetical protein L1987_00021 [Smallanthus sonchifolius]|uniref:Uncharacterized protein n=1 Tax=Smallanthus sonchifolius TaxID=185202 RepID=A0ACB9K170_9ASTR|nr:hypothetical protein L1987_00021 [Smallanthus sonchifolius]
MELKRQKRNGIIIDIIDCFLEFGKDKKEVANLSMKAYEWVLSSKERNFPYPLGLTLLHMICPLFCSHQSSQGNKMLTSCV